MIYANDYVFWGVPRYILMVDRVYKTAAIVDKVLPLFWLYSTCAISYAIFTIRMFLDIRECM